MAKHTKTVGTGITKREVTSYSGEDMAAAFDAFARQWNATLSAGGGSFGARVLDAERACRRIIQTVAGPPPFAADSAEDYARRILRLIDLTKGQIARGDANEAARMAVDIGRLCTEACMKGVWETYALRGEANLPLKAEATRGNKKRQDGAKLRHAEWQAMAVGMWVTNKQLSKHAVAQKIARKGRRQPRHDWRNIIKPR